MSEHQLAPDLLLVPGLELPDAAPGIMLGCITVPLLACTAELAVACTPRLLNIQAGPAGWSGLAHACCSCKDCAAAKRMPVGEDGAEALHVGLHEAGHQLIQIVKGVHLAGTELNFMLQGTARV